VDDALKEFKDECRIAIQESNLQSEPVEKKFHPSTSILVQLAKFTPNKSQTQGQEIFKLQKKLNESHIKLHSFIVST